MAKNGYTTLNLPTALVEELKIWRMAFNGAYGRSMSYAEILRSMIDCLPETEPGVVLEMDHLLSQHKELEEQMASYIKAQRIVKN